MCWNHRCPAGHASCNPGVIHTLEVFIGPAVGTSMFAQLPFISAGSDQSLPLALPNYRKNSVQSRKLVLRIHISCVRQWASCMGHSICWHTAHSFGLISFMSEKKDYFHSSHTWWRVVWFFCDLGRVILLPSTAASSSIIFQLQVLGGSMVLWLLKASSNTSSRFVCRQRERFWVSPLVLCSEPDVNGWS